jgi:hypothetical protein
LFIHFESIVVVFPQDAAADFHHLDQERLGLGILTLIPVEQRQVVHEGKRIGVLLAMPAADL